MAASSTRQLGAVLRKNARLKRRSCCVTCCELFSPAIFCCILVLGFNLSSEEYIKAGLYAALSFDVAPLVDLHPLTKLRAVKTSNSTDQYTGDMALWEINLAPLAPGHRFD